MLTNAVHSYFTHLDPSLPSSTFHGVSIFTRIPTPEKAYRGFRLEALGLLLRPLSTPRPWRHVAGLRTLAEQLYSTSLSSLPSGQEHGKTMEQGPEEARMWFEERCGSGLVRGGEAAAENKIPGVHNWEDDLEAWLDDIVSHDSALPSDTPPTSPLHAIPFILHTLGPSALTVFRFLLARRRVLVLTRPRVEGVGLTCWALGCLASLCGQSRKAASIEVKGVVTLHDIDMLGSRSANGWIAYTTDTIFVDKTECFDLLVDLREVTLSVLSPVSSPSSSTEGAGSSTGSGRARLQVPKGTFEHNGSESVQKKRERGLTSVRFTCLFVALFALPSPLIGNAPSSSIAVVDVDSLVVRLCSRSCSLTALEVDIPLLRPYVRAGLVGSSSSPSSLKAPAGILDENHADAQSTQASS